MTFKKAIGKIHLVLGLTSGLVVTFLGITGCLLAFEFEIRKITDPEQFSPVEARPYLPPSVLKKEAEKYLDGKKLNSLEYPGKGKSAVASYYDSERYYLVAINPYTGKMLKVKNMNRDFFRVVLAGHYNLWLPEETGRPIVASTTLIFLVMMISGIILWWPRSRAARKQRFNIKWNTRWRRVNYDLHNVLGFYMSWIAIFIALTGLVWGFEWFERSVYWVSSGGKPIADGLFPSSDTLAKRSLFNVTDSLWADLSKEAGDGESVAINYPVAASDPLDLSINHRPGTYYNIDLYHFDQYTGARLSASGIYDGKLKDAAIADKIKRMNYDIHVGAVLGLPGKIMAFLASLIAASLPVTGLYIWWGRKKKRPRIPAVPKP
jgi:uncharacterized iron-regulated membrane protein